MTRRSAEENQDTKSDGSTSSERYLTRLARRSFLSLWSYPNLWTDEGRSNGKGAGKELCDLLVIFGSHVILFSDKHCAFPRHPNLEVSWGRWYKSAVKKSVKQLLGAESWIRRFPRRIFLDSHCTKVLPFDFPDLNSLNFHRVAVTRGSYDACAAHFGGMSTGSLMVDTAIQGDQHLTTPFRIGHVAPAQSYVHVLDELSLEVVLRELDTVTDFVAYLEKKRAFLTKAGRVVSATGEEQLVALYLKRMNSNREHYFGEIPDEMNSVFVEEGHWEDFIRNAQYKAKKDADRTSYAWDRLIEHLIRRARRDLGDRTSTNPWDIEPALRVLASEGRVRRRQLAEQLLEAMGKHVLPGQRFLRMGIAKESKETVYVFLILPRPEFARTYEEYRSARAAFLSACCQVAKLRVPEANRVVGIATEPMGTPGASEDLGLLDTRPEVWTKEREQEAKELEEKLEIFREETTFQTESRTLEYPDVKNMAPVPSEYVPDRGSGRPLNRKERRRREKQQRRRRK